MKTEEIPLWGVLKAVAFVPVWIVGYFLIMAPLCIAIFAVMWFMGWAG